MLQKEIERILNFKFFGNFLIFEKNKKLYPVLQYSHFVFHFPLKTTNYWFSTYLVNKAHMLIMLYQIKVRCCDKLIIILLNFHMKMENLFDGNYRCLGRYNNESKFSLELSPCAYVSITKITTLSAKH